MGHFSNSPGAIYPALKRLKKNEWIKNTTPKKKSHRPKEVFSLTDKGWKVLRARLRLPVTRHDIIWNSEELILRFSFMELTVGRKETVHFLKEYHRESDAYVRELRKVNKEMKEFMDTSGKLALELGIEQYKTNANWAKKSIKKFNTK